MEQLPLGKTGIHLSPIGFGAFKIGRNEKIKYPSSYDLPDAKEVDQLLNTVVDMGINYIDTAPAYGISEERIGHSLSHRRNEFVLSTKVGEIFENGTSVYDFSSQSVQASLEQSLKRLKTDHLDIVLIHSNGEDEKILNETDVVDTLVRFRDSGKTKAIGLSGTSPEGVESSLEWADFFMLEYHVKNRSLEAAIQKAHEAGKGIVIKKGLASGYLNPAEAIEFIFRNQAISSLVVGSLNVDHLKQNLEIACQL
jgi:aryl-alcohol dehydrogenase-like predicted oxidoreductase